jgi:hypothetical protein
MGAILKLKELTHNKLKRHSLLIRRQQSLNVLSGSTLHKNSLLPTGVTTQNFNILTRQS